MDEYKQSPRIEHVAGNVTYNQHESTTTPPPAPHKPFRPGHWGWVGGIAAALALGSAVASTQMSTKVYYCTSRNTVKYHTDATCSGLNQCGSRVKSMSLSQARSKMDLCKMCQ